MQSPQNPKIKLKGITFTYDVDVMEKVIKINADEVIQGLLIDDDTGESILFFIQTTKSSTGVVSRKMIYKHLVCDKLYK